MKDSTAISDHVPRRVLTPTRCRVARASSRSRSEDLPAEGVGAKRMRSRARTVARRACLPSALLLSGGWGRTTSHISGVPLGSVAATVSKHKRPVSHSREGR
jgi:hypothetical protein